MRLFTVFFVLILSSLAGCHKSVSDDPLVVTVTEKPHDFLTQPPFRNLTIQIVSVQGFAPDPSTVSNVTSFLTGLCYKPEGIEVVQSEITSPGKSSYSVSDVQGMERVSRTQFSKFSHLTCFVFFADGDFAGNSGNSKVLGVAYGSSSIVLFEKSIRDFAGGVTQPPKWTLESTVLEHEFGHLMGLVNNGSAMVAPHQDTAHGHHCNVSSCLMYFEAETSNVVANLTGGNIPDLDPDCLNDLKANGGF